MKILIQWLKFSTLDNDAFCVKACKDIFDNHTEQLKSDLAAINLNYKEMNRGIIKLEL